MKRRHSDENETSNKKSRKNVEGDIFDDESLNNCFCNADSITRGIGCFTGTVDMFWANVPKKLMLALTTRCYVTGNSTHRVLVTFEGDWVELLQSKLGIIGVADKIELCLDGVTTVNTASGKAKAKLIYKDGAIVRRTRGTDSHFVNSWRSQEEQKNQENLDDWFATPAVPITVRLSDIVRKTSAGGSDVTAPAHEKDAAATATAVLPNPAEEGRSQSNAESTEAKPPSRRNSGPPQVGSGGDSVGITTLRPDPSVQLCPPTIPPPAQAPQPGPISAKSKKARKKAKKQMEKRIAAAAKDSSSPVVTTSLAGSSLTANPPQPLPPASGAAEPQVIRLSQVGMEKVAEDTPEGWMARLRRSEARYTVMKGATKPNIYINLIGVVKSSRSITSTRTGDWTTTIHLQDPSLLEDTESYTNSDFSVVFFQKRFKEWLPQVACGDILILRDIKLQTYDGTISGIGYYDRVKWGVYSIDEQRVVKPTIGDAPEDQELVDGGVRFSPFLQATEPELWYCLRLSEWWKEKSKTLAGSTSQVYQLGDDIFGSSRRVERQHRLFCDAGPDVAPGGYFDCTFEVLNSFQHDNGVYTLFVTDYTANSEVAPCQAQWCPFGLNERVVGFELWDAAAKKGSDFVPGSYWHVRNARMRRGNGGFVEGKIVQDKFGKLDPDSDYPSLKSLLERKKEWEAENEKKQNQFQHKLFKDTTEGEYVNCTVELLHIDNKDRSNFYIFVTDYTAHPEMLSYRPGKNWSQNVEGYIIPILLRGAQIKHTENLKIGSYLSIRRLHLRQSKIEDRFQGSLGGPELLIHSLNVKNPNDDLQALLKRKKELRNTTEKEHETLTHKTKPSMNTTLCCSSIKELNANTKAELKARVFACVIDYYPHQPSRWICLWCSQCRQRIPEDKRACHHCQDMDHEFVQYKFELMLRVEDPEGNDMDLLVKDGCYLRDLHFNEFTQNPTEHPELTRRLSPLLGDIHNLHKGPDRSKKTQYDGDKPIQLIIGRNLEFSPCWILLAIGG